MNINSFVGCHFIPSLTIICIYKAMFYIRRSMLFKKNKFITNHVYIGSTVLERFGYILRHALFYDLRRKPFSFLKLLSAWVSLLAKSSVLLPF